MLYADDLLFFSKSRSDVRQALRVLEKWSKDNGMVVNVDKTKIVKFRRGGKLSKHDVFKYDRKKIEIVNSFEYLGITVQSSWTFTEHLRKRVLKTVMRSRCIPDLQNLSLDAAKKFWTVMLEPIATYGISVIWNDLSVKQLQILDRSKFLFFKRVLGVHKTASNRKVAVLADISSLAEDLVRTGRVGSSDIFRSYIRDFEDRLSELPELFFLTPGILQSNWRTAMCENRSVVMRFSVHGFHFSLCVFEDNHEACDYCVCRYCDQSCSLLHGLNCPAFNSLNDLAQVKPKGNLVVQ